MKLFQIGEEIRVLAEGEVHGDMVPVKAGDIAMHREFGEVQIEFTEERGWHYLRWGCAGFDVDFSNVSLPHAVCATRLAELTASR